MAAPIGQTCPDIDKVIKAIWRALREADEGAVEYPEAKEYFKAITYQLEGLEGSLEDLRNANSTLRGWGEEGDEKIAELEERIDALETEVADLKSEIIQTENN